MNCPVCKQMTLFQKELEKHLPVRECNGCGGRWISSYHYWKWKEQSGGDLAAAQPAGEEPPVRESTGVKLCPECGRFLRRWPVGEGLAFGLDRCGNCGGMWFDRNEWEALRQRGLGGHVHQIFSEIWQHRLRKEEKTRAMEQFYRGKFGPADYQKALETKAWIDTHPHRAELRAFLKL